MVGEHTSNRKLGRIRASAVDLQHLRYAVAAADHGSFRRAAEVLLLRQSTLSRSISQLEYSLGLIVFERFSGGVRATTAGRHFLRTARSILEQMDSLVDSTHHAGCGEAGRLTVGFYTSISAGNLRATLVDYKRRFSQIDVYLKESSRVRLVTALRNGALDIAIVTNEQPLLGNHGMPLWSERILLALLEGHPLTSKDVVYWTDLRGPFPRRDQRPWAGDHGEPGSLDMAQGETRVSQSLARHGPPRQQRRCSIGRARGLDPIVAEIIEAHAGTQSKRKF
jgi:DNA-binding transcriptional LysR family regulator